MFSVRVHSEDIVMISFYVHGLLPSFKSQCTVDNILICQKQVGGYHRNTHLVGVFRKWTTKDFLFCLLELSPSVFLAIGTLELINDIFLYIG